MTMGTKRAGCFIVGALSLFALAAFGLGINWGLPGTAADPYLFNPKTDGSSNSMLAYRMSGAGIDHLAGDWIDDPSLGADVAQHPIDRQDQPVTLVNNPIGFTTEQVLEAGDADTKKAEEARDKLWKKWKKLGEDPKTSGAALNDVNAAYTTADDAVHQAVDAYNSAHIPNYDEMLQSDAVAQARILRRYRLYSYQPDEMITFRALSEMHPGEMQFDPRLYQYGGLWIYPLGAILQAASLTNLVAITPNRGFYLDHPDQFAKFYVVARGYSALWGLVGMLAIYGIVRKVAGGYLLPSIAAIMFVCMPVVLDLAHEAKPHLAGTSLLLVAILAAINYIQTGKMKWALWTSVAVGAAAGMVLSAAVGVVIIPLMVLLRHETPGRRLGVNVLGLLIVIGIYFLTNPYVAVHLIQHDSTGVLASNFGNSRAMYPKAFDLVNAAKLLAVGASPPLLVFGTIGFLILLIKDRRISALGWLLGVPALLILIEFVNHAGNKPGEYARFALFADVALMLAAVLAVGRLTSKTSGRVILGIVLFLPTLLYSHVYDAAFLRDSFPDTSRQEVAEQLSDTLDSQKMTDLLAAGKRPALGMYAEPAPYCMPPMDLFRWKIVLLPPGNTDADVIVQPDQTLDVLNPMSTPMTWANEHFDVNMK